MRLILLFLLTGITACAQSSRISPGTLWLDYNKNPIQAHGGVVTKYHGLYYWYGENYDKAPGTSDKSINCYTSKDLIHWNFRGKAFSLKLPDSILTDMTLERPKVFYNQRTKKFVMYTHVDGHAAGAKGDYSYARLGLAVSEKPVGPFKFVRCFRPFGHESRDIGQFIDDDGTAYLIFEDRSYGFHIARLTADYMNVEDDILVRKQLEAGALVHYKGLYYVMGSSLSGWDPNPDQYASSPSLKGPWSEFKDIAPPETKTYSSQSTYLLKIVGTKNTTVVLMADQWNPNALWDSRYLWMPMEIGDGKLWLPAPRAWTINVKTGKWK